MFNEVVTIEFNKSLKDDKVVAVGEFCSNNLAVLHKIAVPDR